jgi:hypothetical protein
MEERGKSKDIGKAKRARELSTRKQKGIWVKESGSKIDRKAL